MPFRESSDCILELLDTEGLSKHGLSGELQIFRIIQSTQSNCYFLCNDNEDKLVVKHFKNKYVNATLDDANKEFEALASFNKVCRSHPYIRTARPLMLLSSGDGYVMEELEGLSLDKVLEGIKKNRVNLSEIAGRIVEGVKMFHKCTSEPYADFQPRNILIDNNGCVGFIDPTLPNKFFYEVAEDTPNGLLAADIGYWLFNTAVEIVKKGLLRPKCIFQLTRFTILLSTTAQHMSNKSDTEEFLSAAFKAAHRHASRLKISRQVKPFILWLAILPLLWAMGWMCQRGWGS